MTSSSSGSAGNTAKILKRANPLTIQDKFMVGYQGWFTCPGDGEPVGPGHHGWLHWIDRPIPNGGHPNIDIWPDVSSYSPSELFPVLGLTTKTGEPVFLFSSRNAKTVQRHFHWMAEHGVDGVFLQRFAGQCDLEMGNEGIRRIRDEVGDRVREAAEREGRVFAIMYDVSGVAPERIQRILEQDWAHLVRNKGLLDSPNYLKEKGKPVVALWGFGFDGARHTPAVVRAVTHFFRSNTPGGVYIMGGIPANWRTAEDDADRNPGFLDVWMNDFDAISPWTIGRYETEKDADRFCESKMKGDFDLIQRHNEEGRGRKVDYIPVVFPGGSGYNVSQGKWAFNNTKRNGGRFLWKQIANAKRLGVRTIYGAMWDEYDEGTAFMPVVEHNRSLPESDKFRFMALDEDGYDCPADWYMRICGFAAEGLRSERRIHETFPSKELLDYWSSRPKYEPVPKKSGDFLSGFSEGASGMAAGPGDGDGQTYQEWLSAQKEEKEEAPPPPYSLEADEEAARTATPAVVTSTPAQPSMATTAPAVAVVAGVPPVIPQTPASTIIVPHVAPQVNPGAAAVNPGAYPPQGRPSQPHSSVQPGHPYGGPSPAQAQQYPPAAANATTTPTAYNQTPQDPVTSLTYDYGRQSISGPSSTPVDGRVPGSSPPPHPAHPAAAASANPSYATGPILPARPARPHTSHGQRPPSSQQRPPSQPRPPSQASHQAPRPPSQAGHLAPRPQSQQGHSHHLTPQAGAATAPINETPRPASSQPQWPPPEWGVQPTHANHSAHANRPQPPAQGVESIPPGGANLSRPQSFSTSSYGGGGATLRPVSGPRPPNAATPPGSFPASPISENPPPSSAYPGSSPYNTQSIYNVGPPQPTISQVAPTPEVPVHDNTHRPEHGAPTFFNMPSPSPYLPPFVLNTYPGQAADPYAYSGQQQPSAYPSPNYGGGGWQGGPPLPAVGMPTYSGQSTYGHNSYGGPTQGSPPQPQYPGGPSFPSSHQVSPLGSPGGSGGGPPFFPQGPSGDGGYFGSSSNVTMPAASSMASTSTSSYAPAGSPSSPMYPGQYASYPGQAGSGGVSYPQAAVPTPGPWMPSGPPTPNFPPPPRPQSKPPSGPSFPIASAAGSSAYGLALSAVDRVAGRKTREQLENQVGSLAQTGSKLFNKFTK